MRGDQTRNSRPRVLLITFGPFGQSQGGLTVRAHHVYSDLRACGAEVMVLSLGEDRASSWPRRKAEWRPGAVIGLVSSGRIRWAVSLAYLVRKLSRNVDLIVVESALLLIPLLAVTHCPIIWDANGCQTIHYRSRERRSPTLLGRLHMRIAGTVWHEIERWAGRRSIALVAESQAEAWRWHELFPRLGPKIHVVELVPEIGDGHDPLRDGLVAATPRPGAALLAVPPRYVAFVGSNSKHNVDAARWCIHTLAPQLPSTVTIVLAGLGTDSLVAAAGSPRGVIGLGYVDDVDYVLRNAEVCLAPIATGEGPETKVLHYVALGCRVAATPLALEGIEGAPGCHLAELHELTELVVGMLAEGEPVRDREVRQAAQKEWLEKYAAPHRIQEQWMAVLSRVSGESLVRQ